MKNLEVHTAKNEPEEIKCSCGQSGLSRQPFTLKIASSNLVGSTNRSISMVDIMKPYATQINRR